MTAKAMATEPISLFSIARVKLSASLSSKTDCSLHRWVLLKNSLIRPLSCSVPAAPTSLSASTSSSIESIVEPVYQHNGGDSEDDDFEADSFLFPDAGALVKDQPSTDGSEAQWLDSLLETLGDDEDEDGPVDENHDDEYDDSLLSPIGSPLSSAHDLLSQPAYYPPPIEFPYPPAPYPPFEPNTSLGRPYASDAVFDPVLDPNPFLLHALPYHDSDDVEDMSVPDAIEDVSDDESESPLTPLVQSPIALMVDPAMVPLPEDGNDRRRQRALLPPPPPRVYKDAPHSAFYHPFEFESEDPLPFAYLDDHIAPSYNPFYQEC